MTETASLLRTRDQLVADVLRQQLAEERQIGDVMARERSRLRDEVSVWRSAFWIVAVQFLVMFIAAMWGWLR